MVTSGEKISGNTRRHPSCRHDSTHDRRRPETAPWRAMRMSSDPRNRTPRLTVVEGGSLPASASPGPNGTGPTAAATRDVDWSILMAHAQGGNAEAYRRLLEEITPHTRSLAARWCRDPSDVEDAVQDVLLTVHAIRHTYDPTRPFGPWLVAITNRRMGSGISRGASPLSWTPDTGACRCGRGRQDQPRNKHRVSRPIRPRRACLGGR
jgi:hypothetical protein